MPNDETQDFGFAPTSATPGYASTPSSSELDTPILLDISTHEYPCQPRLGPRPGDGISGELNGRELLNTAARDGIDWLILRHRSSALIFAREEFWDSIPRSLLLEQGYRSAEKFVFPELIDSRLIASPWFEPEERDRYFDWEEELQTHREELEDPDPNTPIPVEPPRPPGFDAPGLQYWVVDIPVDQWLSALVEFEKQRQARDRITVERHRHV